MDGGLQALLARHDADPDGVAQALQASAGAPVDPHEAWIYGFLACHLLGERQDRWSAADAAIEQTLAGAADLRSQLYRAVAALRAGRTLAGWELTDALAVAAQAPPHAARLAVVLGVLQFAPADLPRSTLEKRLAQVVGDLADLDGRHGELGRLLAAGLNNVTTRLLEHPQADPSHGDYTLTLMAGAREARTLWDAVGTWRNHERAHYLVARCANRIGEWSTARDAAQAGIAIIDREGPEPLDRAFLLLERARALRHLGEQADAAAALQEAQALAVAFDDPQWAASFEQRAQGLGG